MNNSDLAGLSWQFDAKSITDISAVDYEPVKINKAKNDFSIATIVLGCLFGLTLLLIGGWFIYYLI